MSLEGNILFLPKDNIVSKKHQRRSTVYFFPWLPAKYQDKVKFHMEPYLKVDFSCDTSGPLEFLLF